mmetsp:Transcript_14703/g.17778  ORF Transcript_14703/g.17778 Transcript_14703/m.17778 type:complete len:127 (+) Transcript_14703:79-459(+)|eukprot:CAMPEP_0197863354 /NCGR_PEP_ID=MMETSP1438-20131217/40752_1 /TAXON_ID=1461541 /ORGANISM="Pterosperma sp., Strain CCMP1384" /LENGTH=126 /DNA_ID=CAMNT_0043481221 /DNA_START=72 /DNA_END=452 /DNA_ORIENTATION=+
MASLATLSIPSVGASRSIQSRQLSAKSNVASSSGLSRATLAPPQKADRQGLTVVAGNHATTGIFAPVVRVTRDIVGVKKFNKFRGKAIQLHSQIIQEFCKSVGAPKLKGKLIRQAKQNGERLGFLA